jgi:uncharacterized protein YbjQ (UPF0145 family)
VRHGLCALVIVLAVAVTTGGCSYEVIRVDPLTVEALRKDVPVYRLADLSQKSYRLVRSVTATSCSMKTWDPEPTPEDAIDQLRVKAARLGANGITNVTCERPEGVSLGMTCWASLTCHAAAIVLDVR